MGLVENRGVRCGVSVDMGLYVGLVVSGGVGGEVIDDMELDVRLLGSRGASYGVSGECSG